MDGAYTLEGTGARRARGISWIATHPTGPRLRKRYRQVNLKVFLCCRAYIVEGNLIWALACEEVINPESGCIGRHLSLPRNRPSGIWRPDQGRTGGPSKRAQISRRLS